MSEDPIICYQKKTPGYNTPTLWCCTGTECYNKDINAAKLKLSEYPGTCKKCFMAFPVGTPIKLDTTMAVTGAKQWIHAHGCPATPTKSAIEKARAFAAEVLIPDDDELPDNGADLETVLGKRRNDNDDDEPTA